MRRLKHLQINMSGDVHFYFQCFRCFIFFLAQSVPICKHINVITCVLLVWAIFILNTPLLLIAYLSVSTNHKSHYIFNSACCNLLMNEFDRSFETPSIDNHVLRRNCCKSNSANGHQSFSYSQ